MQTFEIRVEQPWGWVVMSVTVIPAEDAGWIQTMIVDGQVEGVGDPWKMLVWLPELIEDSSIVDEVEVHFDWSGWRRRTRANPVERLAYRIVVRPGP